MIHTIDYLRAIFEYDPEHGLMYKLVGARDKRLLGIFQQSDYPSVKLDGKTYMLHRLAWALHYGKWPDEDKVIDHINGNTHDFRIVNLREITQAENMANKHTKQFNDELGIYEALNDIG